MEKQRKRHLFLILGVVALTLYNILPTVFYYTKPLSRPLSSVEASDLSEALIQRVNRLEGEALDWISSYCSLLQTKPTAITIDEEHPALISVRFAASNEAARFRSAFPRAGSLIPFAPAQLALAGVPSGEEHSNTVLIQRKIPLRLTPDLLQFAAEKSELDRDMSLDRAAQVAAALGGPSEPAIFLEAIQNNGPFIDWVLSLASAIHSLAEIPAETPLFSRCAASFTQGRFLNKEQAVQQLITVFEQTRDAIKQEKGKAAEAERTLLETKEASIAAAEKFLKKHRSKFSAGSDPLTAAQAASLLRVSPSLDLGDRSPFFSELSVDESSNTIQIALHPDISSCLDQKRIEQLLINELAKTSQITNEIFIQKGESYSIALHKSPETKGALLFKLDLAAERVGKQWASYIKNHWHPKHPDLSPENFPIVDWAAYQTLTEEQQALCLLLYTPASLEGSHPFGVKKSSLYFLGKGLNRIAQSYENHPDADLAKTFESDLQSLHRLLAGAGFAAYPGTFFPLIEGKNTDLVFECPDFYSTLLAATREEFQVCGTKKFAFLELSNIEQRILTANKIETEIHEDLLKWRDEYKAAQINIDPQVRYDVPAPTKSVFWDNILLSLRKMIRGDERKIIRWGLDLSGGKTVQIELRDANNRPVTEDADLKQGINELFDRVNKMGVSEVSIRQVGHQIALDFPGSQALSASELVRASTMHFHIVNEKFSPRNPSLGGAVHTFLQEVWNEARVTHKKDPQSIHQIACKHLYGENPAAPQPRSEAAKILLENGLILQSSDDPSSNQSIDDTTSKIALLRGDEPSEWMGQSNPLLIVFKNHAIEGSHLENIRSAYDPSKGNYLSFDVRGASLNRRGETINPRDDLHAWTSRFSKAKIVGTPQEVYSRGEGWRMAVLLNGTVISCPTLNETLRDSAMISGSFSQREVQKLAADLKAGSLTFSPHILSEKNVSPELGKTDRLKGIGATIAALLLVIGSMVLYYRFAGWVASVAVLFNILIMWATLQNLGATLSLAGIAGLILTVGMSVDANVLVFERIKEEFALSGRIGSAIAAGYEKAYSAIVDSNVTTMIAALILLNFDAGPIKAFAVTILIGIASSMFTALFMTRFYFSGWVQNPKNTALSMANWFKKANFSFLKYQKGAFFIASAIILLGCGAAIHNRSTLLGMDFTGGYALHLEVNPTQTNIPADRVQEALVASGLKPQDFQIRELNPSNQLRVLFSTSLESPGKPFHGLPLTVKKEGLELNPRIEWVLQILREKGIELTPSSLQSIHANWTAMSGQMSDSMRNHALLGLLLSFICIFVYIVIRFEYKFAAAASLCLLHDVLITIGSIGLLHFFKVPLQIDLNTIAALMTIIGYSLNDTIIIFDRIREDIRLGKEKTLSLTINRALNATLSRTTITSGTTLLVLLALLSFGGASIFGFALVMTIGVFFGTLSSWFIAAPLFLFFHKKEEAEDKFEKVTVL